MDFKAIYCLPEEVFRAWEVEDKGKYLGVVAQNKETKKWGTSWNSWPRYYDFDTKQDAVDELRRQHERC